MPSLLLLLVVQWGLVGAQGPGERPKMMKTVNFQNTRGATRGAEGAWFPESFGSSESLTIPDMSKMTLCMRIRALSWGNPATLFWYSSSDFDQLIFPEDPPPPPPSEITLALLYPGQLKFSCCDDVVNHVFDVEIELFRWHHLCIALDLTKNDFTIMFDTEIHYAKAKKAKPSQQNNNLGDLIKGGGTFKLGQGMDLDVAESFYGHMADFRLYTTTLPRGNMQKYINCEFGTDTPVPLVWFDEDMTNLVENNDTPFLDEFMEEMNVTVDDTIGTVPPEVEASVHEVSAHSIVEEMPMNFICKHPDVHRVLIPARMNYEEAMANAVLHGVSLTVPTSAEENEEIYDRFSHFRSVCLMTVGTSFWLGLIADMENKKWINMDTNKEISWNNFRDKSTEPKDDFECASVEVKTKTVEYLWRRVSCEVMNCPLYSFAEFPSFRIRGLCKTSRFDLEYTLFDYHSGAVVFQGSWYSRILYRYDTWVIESRYEHWLIAKMTKSGDFSYPLGKHEWELEGDDCKQKKVTLLMTRCTDEEFSCNDGGCVNRSQRCDRASDCNDQSDELNCLILRPPASYTPLLPPPTTSGPLEVEMSLHILSVRKFDLSSNSLELDILQTTTWVDARLRYSNLHYGDLANIIKDFSGKVWIPDIHIDDNTGSPVAITMRRQMLLVMRDEDPLPDDPSTVKEDFVFTGESNSLVLRQSYTVELMCHFDLHMYPFDVQDCLLKYYVLDSPEYLTLEDTNGVVMTGKRQLLEYELIYESTVKADNVSEALSSIKVLVKFSNQYVYYIGNAFFPSLLVIIICYLTLFFQLDDFENRINVSLTAMLVLAALFAQSSEIMPRTSYFKAIDLWYIGLIVIGFLIMVVHIISEEFRIRETPSMVTPYQMKSKMRPFSMTGVQDSDTNNKNISKKINKVAIIFFPIAILGACLVTITAAAITQRVTKRR